MNNKIRRYQKLNSPQLNESILKYRDHDENWCECFKKEESLIKSTTILPLKIAHFGSTAIVNLGSNNIIDIALIVKNKSNIKKSTEELKKIGYNDYGNSPLGENSNWLWKIQNEIAYVIHLDDDTNYWLDDAILFRDYLNSNPKALLEYKSLKNETYQLKETNLLLYSLMKLSLFHDKINEALLWKNRSNR